jgi:hypothetical protein
MDTNNKIKPNVSNLKLKQRWCTGPFLSIKYNDPIPTNSQNKPTIKNNIKFIPWKVYKSKSGKMLNLLDSFTLL